MDPNDIRPAAHTTPPANWGDDANQRAIPAIPRPRRAPDTTKPKGQNRG